MASTDARPVPRKNVAFRLYLAFRKNDGTLITSWTGADTQLSLDGAAYAPANGEATEIGTSGTGYIDLTSSEMNADSLLVKSTVTNTDALPFVIALYPEESGDYRADMTLISGDATAADNAEAFFDGTGYAGTNNVIPSVTTTTNLTNAPTSGDFTATMKASIATELATYDAPTNAEMVARTLLAASYATSAAQTTAQNDLDIITGSDGVTLATTQANYAPAKAGNQMDLVNAPNATAITAIQSGLATASGVTSAFTEIKGATWSSTTDTLEHIRNAITTVGSDVLTNGTLISLIAGAGFDTATDSLEAIRDRGDAAWTTATGFSTLTQADIRTAVGLATANLDTQLGDIPTNSEFDARTLLSADYATATALGVVDSVVDAIKVSTDRFETMIVLDGAVYQFTANALELAPTGGSAPSAADIYTYFTDSNREDAFKADVSGLSTFDHTTDEVTPTAASKTGYKLASDGLDSVSITEPTDMATNFREIVIANWMAVYGKSIKDGDAGTITVYAANGSTAVTTQTYSVVGNVETVNRGT